MAKLKRQVKADEYVSKMKGKMFSTASYDVKSKDYVKKRLKIKFSQMKTREKVN